MYYALKQTYRDPNDKKRVVSKFIKFLGKNSTKKNHLEKMRRRLTGQIFNRRPDLCDKSGN